MRVAPDKSPRPPSLFEQVAAAARHKHLKKTQGGGDEAIQPHLKESLAQKALELATKRNCTLHVRPCPPPPPPPPPLPPPFRFCATSQI